jgi:hypothetical protein
MKMLYKYPQRAFPYAQLVKESHARTKQQTEYELLDTGIFDQDEYFDIYVEYAKVAENDFVMKVTAWNRSQQAAPLHIIPTCWFRNTWSWGYDRYKPSLAAMPDGTVQATYRTQPDYYLHSQGEPRLLFCENETNENRFSKEKASPYPKDAIHSYVVQGEKNAANPRQNGTKVGFYYQHRVPAGESWSVQVRFSPHAKPAEEADQIVARRQQEADQYYDHLQARVNDEDLRRIQRQAYAGMLWTKQFYYYDVNKWQKGDPAKPHLSPHRKSGRNKHWRHLVNRNILSMPDKWEYPWYAAWDLAFHCVPLARLDPVFAKRQLLLMLREYYMHPNGQIPAYEWNFSDVNPPVHAWGAWQVYQIDKEMRGEGDIQFLA